MSNDERATQASTHRRGTTRRQSSKPSTSIKLPDEPQSDPIELDDGSTLTQQQQFAIELHVLYGASPKVIAERCNYNQGSAVSRWLHSTRGREAAKKLAFTHLQDGAIIGLRTMQDLAKNAKSEHVRMTAAADLMDRAGMRTDAGPALPGGNRSGLSINISLGDGLKPDTGQVVEHESSIDSGRNATLTTGDTDGE